MEKSRKSGGGEPKVKKIQVNDYLGATMVAGKTFLSSQRITPDEHIKNFLTVTQMLTAQVPAQQKILGEEIKHLIEAFKPESPTDSIKDSTLRLRDGVIKYAHLLVGASGGNFDMEKDYFGRSLMGNWRLSVRSVKIVGDDVLETLKSLNQVRFGIQSTSTEGHQAMAYQFPVMAPSASLAELKTYDQIADLMIAYKNNHSGDINVKIAEALKVASKKVIGSSGTPEAEHVARELLKFNTTFGNWSSQPLIDAMQRIVRVCLFFVKVHGESLAQYE